MKFENAYIWSKAKPDDEELYSNCDITVPGIGKVKFDHALSQELCDRIRQEAILALRSKFGQTVSTQGTEQ